MLNSTHEYDEHKISIIRNKLKLSGEELNETLDFLQCIGAVIEENRRFLITSHGKHMLSRIRPSLENMDNSD